MHLRVVTNRHQIVRSRATHAEHRREKKKSQPSTQSARCPRLLERRAATAAAYPVGRFMARKKTGATKLDATPRTDLARLEPGRADPIKPLEEKESRPHRRWPARRRRLERTPIDHGLPPRIAISQNRIASTKKNARQTTAPHPEMAARILIARSLPWSARSERTADQPPLREESPLLPLLTVPASAPSALGG
jgi:hypothetical protein